LRTTEIYARAETKAKREALEAASPIRSEIRYNKMRKLKMS